MDQSYVLAMYDIRGKQEFIYRSVKLKEIVGGSAIIRDCFKNYLFPAAVEYRKKSSGKTDDESSAIFDYDPKKVMPFSFAEFEKRMSGDQYIGEVVYSGGGNFLILFKNKEICQEVTYLFSKAVIKNTSGLKVACTYVENLRPELYHNDDPAEPGDYERLYSKHRFTENQEISTVPFGTLPMVQADYRTAAPITHLIRMNGEELQLSSEQFAKYRKYEEERKINQDVLGENQLDAIVTDKGTDSLLAVIYIDGNNMGAKVQKCISSKTYDDSVTALRNFSREIQTTFIDNGMKNINAGIMRVVVHAGDEITIICNAHDAYEAAVSYLKGLPEEYSSCAGIAIFHSHTPFADAYRIAENCCESGKKRMKKKGISDTCLLDFHYCQGAIGIDLDEIRKAENHEQTSLPWLIDDKKVKKSNDEHPVSENVKKARRILRIFGSSNDEIIFESAKQGEAAFLETIKGIISQLSAKQSNLLKSIQGETDERFFSDNRLIFRDLAAGFVLNEEVVEARRRLDLFGRSNVKGLLEPAQHSEAAFIMEIRRIISHMPAEKRKALQGNDDPVNYDYYKENRMLIRDLIVGYDIGFGKGIAGK